MYQMTFEEIAQVLGIKRRRVEQIYYGAIRKLEKKMDKNLLKEMIDLKDKQCV